MKSSLKILSLALSALVFPGCSTIPSDQDRPSLQDVSNNAASGWGATPALIYRTHRQSTDLLRPDKLPEHYYNLPVDLTMSSRLNGESLAHVIGLSGIPTILGSDEATLASVYLPTYKGPIGPLLDSISAASGLSFTWSSGVLIIDKTSPYLLRVPQNDAIGEVIAKSITAMGGVEVDVSKEAGIVAFKASQRDRARIEAFLDRLAVNTSMINLQLAVMNVKLDRDRRSGLDWSALSLDVGDIDVLNGENADFLSPDSESSNGNGSSDTDNSSSGNDGDDSILPLDEATGTAVRILGGNAGLIINESRISLQAVLNMLSTYGESRTLQNLNLKTLSGVEVTLRSGESIPYVEQLNLAMNENTTSSGSNVETVDVGFDVGATPFYDAEDQLVTVELAVSMKTLTGWEEFPIGRDGQNIRHPIVAEQAIANIARLAAGETALVGGLVYESVSDDRTSLTGLEKLPIGSKADVRSYNALFILVRPTVVVYGPRPVVNEVPK